MDKTKSLYLCPKGCGMTITFEEEPSFTPMGYEWRPVIRHRRNGGHWVSIEAHKIRDFAGTVAELADPGMVYWMDAKNAKHFD